MAERRSRARTAGLVGAAVGAAAAGVAGGLAVRALLTRRDRAPAPVDPYADEPFDALPADAELVVTTDEGVDLHVEVVEPPGRGAPALTVVFVHGYALDSGTFHFQRKALTELTSPRLRIVAYDQPGHGRSGRLPAGEYSIDALGGALWRVIEEVAPDGPLALVGHSMGGMTIMALAERHPELFEAGGRVRAVAFVSTSAGELAGVPLGLPKLLPRASLLPALANAAKLTPGIIDRARGAAGDIAYLLTRRYGFAGATPSPAVVKYVERMNARTSVESIAGYVKTLYEHRRYRALEALRHTRVLVIAGDKDVFTPLSHAQEITRLLPNATLLVLPDAGHMALLEYPDAVTEPLRVLLVAAAKKRSTT
jgi:pimeloyl-ACP methyl ester carboxylesterase